MDYAQVTLRGLTVGDRVYVEGDLIPLAEMPEHLQKRVKTGQHPHLKPVKAESESKRAAEPETGE